MKKYSLIFIIVLVSFGIFLLGFDYKRGNDPKTYYQVYLNDEILGVIKSKKQLEKYIDSEGSVIKRKYKVNSVYAPTGLQVKKITSFDTKIDDVKDIYSKILEKSPFTVKGYQISIKKEDETKIIYVTQKEIFEEATTQLIKTFVGGEIYEKYMNDSQLKIVETGELVENIYIEESENWTIKELQIETNKNIYIDSDELSKFLLFGTNEEQKKYKVEIGDTIEKVIFTNEISKEEFFISNPEFTSENNLLFPGQEVTIGITDPQLSVVVEKYVIEDIENKYRVEEKIDEKRIKGDNEVIQTGQNGMDRVSQRVKVVNETIVYVDPVSKQELKPTINQIVIKGDKFIPNIGSTSSWGWPTDSGYTITSDYAWRINPVTFKREHHSGIDIAGLGYGAPVYAANNGTIITVTYGHDYGNFVIIDHNNGYYTLYAHMSTFSPNAVVNQTIARGQIIGYIGSTGWSTGPHLHYEAWKDCRFCRISPWSLYK